MKIYNFDTNVEKKLREISFRRTIDSPLFLSGNFPLNPDIEFGNPCQKYVLELGSGWGEVAIELALANPETGYILLERKMKRIKKTLKEIEKKNISNIRILPANFSYFLDEIFSPGQFDRIILNFPDPWPKKRHHKNRAVNPEFITLLHHLLKNNGIFSFATDHGPYARQVIKLFRNDKRFGFDNEYYFSRPSFPASRFENEKREEGKRIYYLDRIKM